MHDQAKRTKITALGMVLMGVTMIVIGALGPIAPPIITGLGFFLFAWWLMGNYPKG